MKKTMVLTLSLSGLLISSSGMAFDSYIGVGGGAYSLMLKKEITGYREKGAPAATSISRQTYGIGPSAAFSAGVNFSRQRYSLGLQAQALVNLAKGVSTVGGESFKPYQLIEKMPLAFNLSVLPGFKISPNNTAYGRLGFAFGELTSTPPSSDGNYEDPSVLGSTKKFKQWLPGFIAGVGVDSRFSNHWSMNVEYDYSLYHAYSITHETTKKTGLYDYKYHPSSNQIMFGLTFHFTGYDNDQDVDNNVQGQDYQTTVVE